MLILLLVPKPANLRAIVRYRPVVSPKCLELIEAVETHLTIVEHKRG